MQTPPFTVTIFRRQGASICSRGCSGVGPCVHPEPREFDDLLVVWLSLSDGNITRRCNSMRLCWPHDMEGYPVRIWLQCRVIIIVLLYVFRLVSMRIYITSALFCVKVPAAMGWTPAFLLLIQTNSSCC